MRNRLIAMSAAIALHAAAVEGGASPQDIGSAVYRSYLQGRHAEVLRQERTCWRAAVGAKDLVRAGVCVRWVVASGVMDAAMARRERRSPLPDFAPDAQRTRVLAQFRALGLDEAAAQPHFEAAVSDLPALMSGLMEAGMR
jgi:hypothetical protein